MISEEMKAAGGDWTKIPDYIQKYIPRDMAFLERTGEFNWYPSTKATLSNYIPIVERKLAFQPYLIHWRDTIEQAATMGSKAGQEARAMITRNMYKAPSLSNKISNSITQTNYFLQLFGNARVAVKHIIGGFPGSVSEIGMFTTPEVLYSWLSHPMKSAELIRTYSRLQDIVKTLETTSGMDISVPVSRFIKALQGQPTASAEFVENGINILGSMLKGAKQGVDPELLRDYIWNKVTSVNFRGGWDIPKVFANPGWPDNRPQAED